MPIEEGWIDITDRLGLEKTFGRRIVVKEVEGEKYRFMRMAVPDGIQVLGLDEYGQVIAITETRKDTGEGKAYCHLVGGAIDNGELPREAAIREFLEETGYEIGNLVPLGAPHKDSAHLLGTTFAFLATSCTKERKPEDGIEVTLMTFKEFEEMLYEYVSKNPNRPRDGGNSIITLWLAKQWIKLNS